MAALIASAIGLPLCSIFLAENALRVQDHARAPLEGGLAFARSTRSQVETVRIRAEDGALLEAWLFTPARPNGAAAIVLHGVADTRKGVLEHARFLLESGYTVLTPDSRGHGASAGAVITYGVLEAADVHRWADLLMERPGIVRLYGVGQSMGAAILIQSLAKERRFHALVADCPFATFEEIAFDRMAQHGARAKLLSWPLVELGFLYTRARYGPDLWRASPADALRASRTPVLLIHGTADDNIPIRHSRELHSVDPADTELWEVAGAGHVECYGRDPGEYAGRVTRFFAAHPEVAKSSKK
ncbi:MAG TPA: alpha/beta fold hydrolase [Candidatus Acidoferrum sp.]|nr:alpha/beta fold hydrolase [Candidatus Acidoferrum sp.]